MGQGATEWVLETTGQERFPYRLTIRRGGEVILALRVQERWPGGSGNVFCLRERDDSWPDPVEEIERVGVVSVRRFGKRVSIVLDRSRRRRCELLFLKRPYKNRPGTHEQIFWQTEQGLRERRPRARFVGDGRSPVVDVAVSPNEQYAWKFPGWRVERVTLPVGDYAALDDGLPVAVVERKTFANLLRDLSDLRALHHVLAELAACPCPAVVVEAAWADFLKPERVKPLNVAYTSRALAEIAALHPGVQLVFAGNRKLAVEWTRAFFLAALTHYRDASLPVVREVLERYGEPPPHSGADLAVRRDVLHELEGEFSIAVLRERHPGVADDALRRVLNRLRDVGRLACSGRGRSARWRRVEAAPPAV